MSPADLKALIQANSRIMVQQPAGYTAKPRFHVWDLVGRIVNTMEETYQGKTVYIHLL